MKRLFLLLFIYIIGVGAIASAQECVSPDEADTTQIETQKVNVFKKVGTDVGHGFKNFGIGVGRTFAKLGRGVGKGFMAAVNFLNPEQDTTYIELQEFNIQAMLQATCNFDSFRAYDDNYEIVLGPDIPIRVGPYAGWRWLFFGYTVDVKSLDFGNDKIDVNTSFYTPALCFDIIYRKLGSNYRIKSLRIGDMDATPYVKGKAIEGFDIDVFSLNVSYSVNGKRYSHQAAFNQSTRQLRSAGSMIIGLGYNDMRMSMEKSNLDNYLEQLSQYMENHNMKDSSQLFRSVSYKSIPVSLGYGYNWVLGKNFLASAQLSTKLSYVFSKGESFSKNEEKEFAFDANRLTLDGTARLGVVWSNARWFAGTSAIFHTYYYHDHFFKMNNLFGTFNLYVGYNFYRRKAYRHKGVW